MKNLLAKMVLIAAIAAAAAGCSKDGPAENAGEKIDEAAANAGDKIDQAATDAGNKMEDECEKAKKAMGADHTGC